MSVVIVKKILIISLTFLYLAFNAGVLINFHFCGNTFHHFTIIIQPKDCCNGDNSCCHNTSYELKIIGEYDSTNNLQVVTGIHFDITPWVEHGTGRALSHYLQEPDSFRPREPMIQFCKHPLYLTNRAFII